jgi:hypothetical protein
VQPGRNIHSLKLFKPALSRYLYCGGLQYRTIHYISLF